MTSAPHRRLRLAPSLLGLALALAGAPAGSGDTPPPLPEGAEAFVEAVVKAWSSRDLAAWMALWDLPAPQARTLEEAVAREAFDSDQASLTLLREPTAAADGRRLEIEVQSFVAHEPRAGVAHWRLLAQRRDDRWVLVSRQDAGRVDGLVHLALGPTAWRARGLTLHAEDFELQMQDGSLYTTPETLGPTVLVFVGRGRVAFRPQPPGEREQLRQFAGTAALNVPVEWAYARLSPGDLAELVGTARLEPAPDTPLRRQQAERVFRARSPRSFMIDAPLPRSPWWLLPGSGDVVVDFPWHRGRVLTYAYSGTEAEDVNLFERDRRAQICMYASAGRPPDWNEDSERTVDVLDQDLMVRFDPARMELAAVHSMRLRMLGNTPTLRLRLDDDLKVSSVSTGDGTRLLYFRVREQNGLVVALGTLADRSRPLTVVTRYAGRHDPAPVDQELVQLSPTREVIDREEVFIDRPPLVYSNRTSWYPRPPIEDFSTATVGFDTPEGWLAVTGGEQLSLRSEGRRTHSEFRLAQPGKYLTAVVGRLSEVGTRRLGTQSIRAYATTRTHSEAGREAALLEQMLAFYSELFGPCPYPALGLVVAESQTPGGHSPPGLLYLQLRPQLLRGQLADDPANFSDLPGFFLAHEAAHQWWGEATAPSSYRERWLSEAWAQYAAALWIRHRLGEDAFRSMLDRMGRWAFRHDAAGAIHLGQRLGMLRSEPQVFRAVVYDKGAWVLHMLRGIVGDDAFFRGARAFLESHRYAKAGSADMRQALETASGRDLQPYFARWVYDTGLPVLAWSERTEAAGSGRFRTTVQVRPENLPGPVPLQITLLTATGREPHQVALAPGGGAWTFDSVEKPRQVLLNDDRALLARLAQR
ncbi:MAG TPA: M1 family aminopeptidase [Vicinamibacteria bacterium]|nr:M1 family aminopeptidase [Vicinamibacteria bacterium]